jgi:hypothetical protein
MGVLAGSLVATGAVLLALALIHAYAQWTIRNIDQENQARVRTGTGTSPRASDSRREPE